MFLTQRTVIREYPDCIEYRDPCPRGARVVKVFHRGLELRILAQVEDQSGALPLSMFLSEIVEVVEDVKQRVRLPMP